MLTLSLLLAASAAPQVTPEPSIECSLEHASVYRGEGVGYEVKVLFVNRPPQPDLGALANDFQVEFLGDESFSNFFIFNGRQQGESGHRFRYRLTPLRSGTLVVPAPELMVDGETLVGNTTRIEVREPDEQNFVFLELTVDRARAYPLQPFTVTLDVLVREVEPPDGRRSDPLTLLPRSAAPGLEIPWVDTPAGLSSGNLDDWLGRIMRRSPPGFTINGLTARDSFMLSRSAAVFLPEARWVTREVDGEEVSFRRYRISRAFRPEGKGSFSFGPVTFRGPLATGFAAGTPTFDRFFTLSEAVRVEVVDPPAEGRPASWTGGVGSFSLRTSLAPTRVRVGDPMTFTLTVEGSGNLDDLLPPDLDAFPEIAAGFKVYDATTDTRDGKRLFTYGLRALHEEVTELPGVPFSYFDPASESYRSVATEPIAIDVRPAEGLDGGDIVVDPKTGTRGPSVESSNEGYLANSIDAEELLERPLGVGALLGYCGALCVTYVVAAGLVGRRRRLRDDPARLRRHGAPRRAREALEAAAAEPDGRRRAEALAGVFGGLFADLSSRPAEGLTAQEIDALAAEAGVGESERAELRAILEECDAARFGAEDAAEQATPRAKAVLEALLRHVGVALLLLTLGLAGCRRAAPPEIALGLQTAQQAFLDASEPEEFLAVAAHFESLAERAGPSGALLFDAGNAYARAGASGEAVAAYRRALRHRPRDPAIAHNLVRAQAGAPSLDDRSRGFFEQLFFWQRLLSASELAWWAAVTASLAFVSALSGLLLRQPALRRAALALTLLTALAVAAAAGLNAAHREGGFGVIVSSGTIARTGNSESYEPAFTQPLVEATEFEVLATRGEWLRVRLPGELDGWIPARAAVVY